MLARFHIVRRFISWKINVRGEKQIFVTKIILSLPKNEYCNIPIHRTQMEDTKQIFSNFLNSYSFWPVSFLQLYFFASLPQWEHKRLHWKINLNEVNFRFLLYVLGGGGLLLPKILLSTIKASISIECPFLIICFDELWRVSTSLFDRENIRYSFTHFLLYFIVLKNIL